MSPRSSKMSQILMSPALVLSTNTYFPAIVGWALRTMASELGRAILNYVKSANTHKCMLYLQLVEPTGPNPALMSNPADRRLHYKSCSTLRTSRRSSFFLALHQSQRSCEPFSLHSRFLQHASLKPNTSHHATGNGSTASGR